MSPLRPRREAAMHPFPPRVITCRDVTMLDAASWALDEPMGQRPGSVAPEDRRCAVTAVHARHVA